MAEFIIRLIIEGPEGTQNYVVPAGSTIMGRQAGNEIHLNDPLVSRQHARLDCSDKGCTLTDLGSANGTILNDERLQPQVPYPLQDQAVIQVGPFRIVYEQTQIVIAAPEPPPPPVAVEPPVKETPPELPATPKESGKPAKPEKPKATGTKPPTPLPSDESVVSMPPQRPPKPKEPDFATPPPGLSPHSDRYLSYLPGIYQNDFMGRFLGMLEAIMAPIEWNVDNFDLFLDPKTAPPGFLPWLESWFTPPFDTTWSDTQKRQMLQEASQIYARRGTKWALSRVLEIYIGVTPEIRDLGEGLDDFTFLVKLPIKENQVKKELVENLINTYKPAHTMYQLSFAN